jgi:hypothetical protein
MRIYLLYKLSSSSSCLRGYTSANLSAHIVTGGYLRHPFLNRFQGFGLT